MQLKNKIRYTVFFGARVKVAEVDAGSLMEAIDIVAAKNPQYLRSELTVLNPIRTPAQVQAEMAEAVADHRIVMKGAK